MVWFWWIIIKRCFVLPVKLCSSRQPKATVPNNSQPPLAWVSHQWLVVSWYEAAMPECTEVQLKIGQVWVRTMLLTLCHWAWECVVCMFFAKEVCAQFKWLHENENDARCDQIYFPGLWGVNLKQYFASGPPGAVSGVTGWRPENGTTAWNVDAKRTSYKEKSLNQPCEKEQQSWYKFSIWEPSLVARLQDLN